MPISLIIQLIAQEGLPVAEKLWNLWQSKATVTQADWDTLKLLSAQNAKSQLAAAVQRAGLDFSDPRLADLLKMSAT
jgi:hypothetical protein